MLRCCVFTFSTNTHSHVHQHHRYSSAFFYFIPFCVHFCIRWKFIYFFMLTGHSSTRWWWNGYMVWFGRLCVVLIFHIRSSLLWLGWPCGWQLGERCTLFMCGIFSMIVVCGGLKRDLIMNTSVLYCINWTVHKFIRISMFCQLSSSSLLRICFCGSE